MPYRLLLLLMLLQLGWGTIALGQARYNDNWVFGYGHDFTHLTPRVFGGSLMHFEDGVVDTSFFQGVLRMTFGNVSISDPVSGELLFYSNGRHIANANHEYMQGGEDFSPAAECCFGNDGQTSGATLILPTPEDSSLFYLFHTDLKFIQGFPNGIGGQNLYYTKIDMDLDGGLGAVVETKVLLLNDTLDNKKLTATRHANGRDWWLMLPEYRTNRIFRILLTPEGPQILDPQIVPLWMADGLGNARFSPDGEHYANISLYTYTEQYLFYFDFDRCTGLFSNFRQELFEGGVATTNTTSLAFSPSGRMLYRIFNKRLYQYDTWADDVLATGTLVGEYDGYTEYIPVLSDSSGGFNFSTKFYNGATAPDGKIYIAGTTSIRSLHVINSPDSLGAACDFQQHSFLLPTLNDGSMPNHVNFDLGPLEGSACDTLGPTSTTMLSWPAGSIQAYPNPTVGPLGLAWTRPVAEGGMVLLFDAQGRLLEQHLLSELGGVGGIELDLEDYPKGMYFYQLRDRRGVLGSGKVVKE